MCVLLSVYLEDVFYSVSYLCKFITQRYVYSNGKQNLTYAADFLAISTA